MQFSKYSIYARLRDSDDHFLINSLRGSADILTAEKAREIGEGSYTDEAEYVRKGYLVDPDEEERLYRKAYLDFLERRDDSEVQIFFVPGYACNFACDYCYQDEYVKPARELTGAVIDAFFAHVDRFFAGRKKYITLFGGEPLLPDEGRRAVIDRFIDETARRGIDLAVVTNGYTLASYLPALGRGRVREIQVTLDGVASSHDLRRPLRGGGSTFERIVDGIDAALALGMPVNLRMVVDRENLPGLPALAAFAEERGWTKLRHFKTQLGRNYELHHCQARGGVLYDRAALSRDLYDLYRADPGLEAFHRPAFSVARHLYENGELPLPLFDACPGCKTEWAFDYTGSIYPCTAMVGKAGEEVGTFYPEVRLDEARVGEWEDRDVTAIAECRSCSMQHLCGGGCGAVAKNATGSLHTPDCRPVKELLELGIAYYFKKEETPCRKS